MVRPELKKDHSNRKEFTKDAGSTHPETHGYHSSRGYNRQNTSLNSVEWTYMTCNIALFLPVDFHDLAPQLCDQHYQINFRVSETLRHTDPFVYEVIVTHFGYQKLSELNMYVRLTWFDINLSTSPFPIGKSSASSARGLRHQGGRNRDTH
jgi:hypothetical protein